MLRDLARRSYRRDMLLENDEGERLMLVYNPVPQSHVGETCLLGNSALSLNSALYTSKTKPTSP